MDLTVKGADLARAVGAVDKFAPDRAALPILACVKLTASAGALEIRATNLDQALSVTIPAVVGEVGAAIVLASAISGQAKFLTGADVMLKSDGEASLTMREPKGSRVKFPGMAVADFPEMLDVADGVALTFKARSLSQAIRRSSFCAATDKTRYQLAGLRLKANPEVVSLTATDGHRLAYLPVPPEAPVTDSREAILPADALKTLADLLADQDGDVAVVLGSTMVGATFGTSRFAGRLIEGNYPNIEGVMAKVLKGDRRYAVPVVGLSEAIQRALSLSHGKNTPLKLSFEMGGTLLTVRLREVDLNDADFPVVVSGTGPSDDVHIGVNGRYILDGLAQAAGETVTLVLTDSKHPLAMVGDGAPNYVVMPMKLGD